MEKNKRKVGKCFDISYDIYQNIYRQGLHSYVIILDPYDIHEES